MDCAIDALPVAADNGNSWIEGLTTDDDCIFSAADTFSKLKLPTVASTSSAFDGTPQLDSVIGGKSFALYLYSLE